MILNGRMFKFSVPTPGDHRSPLRTDGVSCAKSKPIKVNLNAKLQFIEQFEVRINSCLSNGRGAATAAERAVGIALKVQSS